MFLVRTHFLHLIDIKFNFDTRYRPELVGCYMHGVCVLVATDSIDFGIIPPFLKHYVLTRQNETKQLLRIEDQY
jgi:hypothetical protein